MPEQRIGLPGLTDPQLVQMARQGDKEAFGELIRRHSNRCIDLASFLLRNRGDGEDEAQNAFLKAYKHLDQYQGDADFATWLARIVANQCLMLMRVRRRASFVYLDDAYFEPQGRYLEVASTGPDPEGELGFVQMTEVLKMEIRRIPPLLRNVMLLRDIQEKPMSQVADELGVTLPAAKSRLLRARTELRSRLKRHCEHLGRESVMSHTAAPLSKVRRHHTACVAQI